MTANNSRLSKPIVVVSLLSIVVGVATMLISVAIVTGFQEGVREKVIGFGSHIQVTSLYENTSMESSPIPVEQEFYPSIATTEDAVRHIQTFAYKPAILQSNQAPSGTLDTLSTTSDIHGVLFKGVDERYDWDFFEGQMVSGGRINFAVDSPQVVVSEYIADKMGYRVGSQLDAFFIMANGPKKRTFEVCGIYKTGFETFDQQFLFTSIEPIQRLNNWGFQSLIGIRTDTCIDGKFLLEAQTRGGDRRYLYEWKDGKRTRRGRYLLLDGQAEATVHLVSREAIASGESPFHLRLLDTATARAKVDTPCGCSAQTLKQIAWVSEGHVRMPFGAIVIEQGKGTHHHYVGGFEILIDQWSDLEKMDELIYFNIPGHLTTQTIVEMYPDIFAWLDFLDVNIVLIIALVLMVALVNMITSLLVTILEKFSMIGLLKAMGATASSVRKIFLHHAIFLLSRGLLWGNGLGLGLILLQDYTGIFSLDPEVYYLDRVPVKWDVLSFLGINALTVVVCRVTLILPSFLISRVDPVKAIRFD